MSIIAETENDQPERDYFWLVEQIKSWMHRTDLGTEIPTFIVMAEARISTMLHARLQDTRGTLNTVAGVATVALPSPLLSVHSLSIPNVMSQIDYQSPGQLDALYSSSETGAPRYYTVVGGDIRFAPVPDAVYQVACTYQAEALALTAAAPTNSLLTKWPNVYLFGALIEGADWSQDDALLQKWQSKFQAAISGINLLNWNTSGPLHVRCDTRTP